MLPIHVIQATSRGVRSALDGLLALLLAPRCAACEALLSRPLDGAVCEGCWERIRLITPPACRLCGDPLPSWRTATLENGTCPRCRRAPGHIDRGGSAGHYEGALRSIVHALKYEGRRSIAPDLAALMRSRCRDLLLDADAIVPVPLHARRLRARGFNQAEEIARHLELPVMACLWRQRDTQPQNELPASRRHRNVRDAFGLKETRAGAWRRGRWGQPCADSPSIAGKRLVLVDDVSTTGATLQECARMLKLGGAREVRAVTAARVVRSRP
ncbi:MAG: ComF family protein [Acidobacteria bacterium]|nr:ComF family protein [Acidobacteriota bacterium]